MQSVILSVAHHPVDGAGADPGTLAMPGMSEAEWSRDVVERIAVALKDARSSIEIEVVNLPLDATIAKLRAIPLLGLVVEPHVNSGMRGRAGYGLVLARASSILGQRFGRAFVAEAGRARWSVGLDDTVREDYGPPWRVAARKRIGLIEAQPHPAAITETAFADELGGLEWLLSPGGRGAIAEAHVRAIMEALK